MSEKKPSLPSYATLTRWYRSARKQLEKERRKNRELRDDVDRIESELRQSRKINERLRMALGVGV